MPPRVDNIETYWADPSPVRSPRCQSWVERIESGWTPNRRIRAFGYHEAAEWFGVYIWEWVNVLRPLLHK